VIIFGDQHDMWGSALLFGLTALRRMLARGPPVRQAGGA